MKPARSRNLLAGALVAVLVTVGGVSQAPAQELAPTSYWNRILEKAPLERVWEAARLYENEDNPVIQAFAINGVYQGQYWAVDARQGDASGW